MPQDARLTPDHDRDEAKNGIYAVVVTYQPERERLVRLLSALQAQVERVVIVDNGSADADLGSLIRPFPQATAKKLGSNRGLAAAQNEGIALARSQNAEYVMLLDQDSVPEREMVPRLRSAMEMLRARGVQVACVGPRLRSAEGEALSRFARIGLFGLRVGLCVDERATLECDFLISSGSLIPMEVIGRVGGMEEALFIDQVDVEWCLRARASGYRTFGACGAILEHQLGERGGRRSLGRWRSLPRHKAFRYYYIFRNSVLLWRRAYVPLRVMAFQFRWLAALFLAYGIFSGTRSGELSMMLKGLLDGLRGVDGKLQLPRG